MSTDFIVMERLQKRDYNVGWLCALPIELAAATAMLDYQNSRPRDLRYGISENHYIFGSIGPHNVIITSLPYGIYGTTSAANVVNSFKSDFPDIHYRFMVGIGGGATVGTDIRLGDVVVSAPTETSPGVIQYDFGKTIEDGGFMRVGVLAKPPQGLLRALPLLCKVPPYQLSLCILSLVHKACSDSHDYRFNRPEGLNDLLFHAHYQHPKVTGRNKPRL
ncbi:hypothetical protein ABW20_dc0108811 [Dactylellina cionopaga]|nr:hypothetical protein ABW20_dc0108811 [Dactylellina cionopaga]